MDPVLEQVRFTKSLSFIQEFLNVKISSIGNLTNGDFVFLFLNFFNLHTVRGNKKI
jgi:hypothetical protein